MQAKVEAMQQQLASQTFTSSAAGGAVLATVNGRAEVTSLKLDPEFLKESPEVVAQTIVSAISQAQTEASKASESQMQSLANPLKGLFG